MSSKGDGNYERDRYCPRGCLQLKENCKCHTVYPPGPVDMDDNAPQILAARRGQNPRGQNPGGQNPGGQNPGGQNAGGQNNGGQNQGGQIGGGRR